MKKGTVLSLGAGVQSTTIAMMCHVGEFPKPDYAIFADTGWEPKAVYDNLEWIKKTVSFPVVVVKSPFSIKESIIIGSGNSSKRYVSIPYYIQDGIVRRQCTNEFKLAPMRRFIREKYAPWKKGEYVETWIGISKDEATRMKDSLLKYMVNKWPLIDMNMDRQACKDWMENHGFPIPPKSSCIGCPFHNDELWLEMKRKYPDEWKDACETDKLLRNMKGMKWPQYMHRSCIDLDRVDLREDQLNLFENECTGMCAT